MVFQLKELNERQRQINHKRHVAQGALDPSAPPSRFPPKVLLISKYERRTDRRTFAERKNLFEKDGKPEEQKELVKPKGKVRADWLKNKDVMEKAQHDDDEEGEQERNDHEQEGNLPPTKMSNIEEEQDEEQENHVEELTETTSGQDGVEVDEGESLW